MLTSTDYDNALHLYRDVLGLREEASFTDDNGGRATLLHAGRATLELGDAAHADVDRRAGGGARVAGPVRVAFEVADAAGATDDLVGAGAELVAGPVRTPWGSVNARLDGPDGPARSRSTPTTTTSSTGRGSTARSPSPSRMTSGP